MTDLQDHPEYRQLANAVRAAPDDDLPRLVLADWLEEHDAPEWAEFIRVHCEAARHPHAGRIWADTFTDANAVDPEWQRALTCARLVRELWPRVAEVICGAREEGERAQITWDGRCFFGDPRGSRPQFEVRRGFVERVRCAFGDWFDDSRAPPIGPSVSARQPVREVTFPDREFPEGRFYLYSTEGNDRVSVRPVMLPWCIARRLRPEHFDRREEANGVLYSWYFLNSRSATRAVSAAAIEWALEEAEQANGAT